MSSVYLGEIAMFGGNFNPRGFALCNGQILALSQNTALFSLLGTTYGGNGTSNFALPNMQAATPMFWGQGPGLTDYIIGETYGVSKVTVTTSEMLQHNHTVVTAAAGQQSDRYSKPGNTLVLGDSDPGKAYATATTPIAPFSPLAISTVGGQGGAAQPHANQQPYLAVSFIIALQGVYPARN